MVPIMECIELHVLFQCSPVTLDGCPLCKILSLSKRIPRVAEVQTMTSQSLSSHMAPVTYQTSTRYRQARYQNYQYEEGRRKKDHTISDLSTYKLPVWLSLLAISSGSIALSSFTSMPFAYLLRFSIGLSRHKSTNLRASCKSLLRARSCFP